MGFLRDLLYRWTLDWEITEYTERERIITTLDERMNCPKCGLYKGMRIKSIESGFNCTRCDHHITYVKFRRRREYLGRKKMRNYSHEDDKFWEIAKKYGVDL